LPSAVAPLVGEQTTRDLAQLLLDQVGQAGERLVVATVPGLQQAGQIRVVRHVRRSVTSFDT